MCEVVEAPQLNQLTSVVFHSEQSQSGFAFPALRF